MASASMLKVRMYLAELQCSLYSFLVSRSVPRIHVDLNSGCLCQIEWRPK
ncbi:Uncharacterised protein [BD1-7 clade bacterium]|nr:Uncharacterised protein [BD1-7 clade bacterium]